MTISRLRSALAALVLLGVNCLAAFAATPQQVEGLVNLRFQLDARVFAVMSALNAAGFDLDADALERNPVRKLVREKVANAPAELRGRLHEFYRAACQGQSPETAQSKFVSYAVLLNGPPGFELPFKPDEVPEDARPVIGFEPLVAQLWREASLEQTWRTVNGQYVAEAEAYRPLLRDIIVATLRYMRTAARIALDREVAFIPDFMNGYGIVNARNIGNTYIVVVGPSRTPQRLRRSLRHEYLHFLLDPLIAKHHAALPAPEPFLARVRGLPSSLPRYRGDFTLMLTESLIRTVELRLDGMVPAHEHAAVLQLYDEGLILSPYFDEALQRFETHTYAMQEFFPELIEGVRWETEETRPLEVERWRKRLTPRPENLEPADAEGRGQLGPLLAEGNRLLLARQFEAAGQVLQKALELDPLNASALFGLGQVCAQGQEYDLALDYYARAAANAKSGEAWLTAWSYVRRGNIFRFQDEPEKARNEWKRVLGLRGDLRGAREAATKALEEK